MDPDERAQLAAKAVELFVSEGPYNPPVTFGGYRLAVVEKPGDGRSSPVARLACLLMMWFTSAGITP